MAGFKASKKKQSKKTVKSVTDVIKLNQKRADFVREYLIDYSVTKASERAGLSSNYGYKLIKNPDVIRAVMECQSLSIEYKGLNDSYLVGQMAIWSKSNIGDYFDDNWNLKRKSELTDKQLSCVESVERKTSKDGVIEFKLKLMPKMKANENLSRHFGLYEAPKDDDSIFDDMSISEIEEWLKDNEY